MINTADISSLKRALKFTHYMLPQYIYFTPELLVITFLKEYFKGWITQHERQLGQK